MAPQPLRKCAGFSVLDMSLVQACAGHVPAAMVNAIVAQESGFNPYAIGVNRASALPRQPSSQAEAVHVANQLLASGKNIDMGLGQINSNNLAHLGLNTRTVFDPCTNLKALQSVYLGCLDKAQRVQGPGLPEQRALSCYNTGSTQRGFKNGYVNKVTRRFNAFLNQMAPAALFAAPAVNIKADTATTPATQEALEPKPIQKARMPWDVFTDY